MREPEAEQPEEEPLAGEAPEPEAEAEPAPEAPPFPESPAPPARKRRRGGLLRSLGFGLPDEARREREGGAPEPAPEPEPVAEEPEPVAVSPHAEPIEPDDPDDDLVSLNHGTFEDYRALGMSVTQAKRVITYRGRLDGYTHVDQLEQVPGFPQEFLATLKQRVKP